MASCCKTWVHKSVLEFCSVIWKDVPWEHVNWQVLVNKCRDYGICRLLRYGECFWPSSQMVYYGLYLCLSSNIAFLLNSMCMNNLGDPILSRASTKTVNFKDFGITRARNCLPESVTCLYNSPLMWVKVSNSCCGALLFNSCLDMHLQNGPVLCICSNASNLSAVSGFGVGVVSWEILGEISGCGVSMVLGKAILCMTSGIKSGSVGHERLLACWHMLLLSLVLLIMRGQSAALFCAPENPFKDDIVCGQFQTPSGNLVISLFAI